MKHSHLVGISAIIIHLITIMIVPAQCADIRSDIHDLREKEVTLDSYTFPGFYYDIDNDIGTEMLTFKLSDMNQDRSSAVLSDQVDAGGNRGAEYITESIPVDFSFSSWGQYEDLGFLGGEYFAAYDGNVTSSMALSNQSVPFLYDNSMDRNLMTSEQISEIMIDDDTEQTFDSSTPLELEEGYKLAIKSVDENGNKVYLELSKNGRVVDSKVVSPSIENADMVDQTYYYKKDLGGSKDIVIIAVHFKNAFSSAGDQIATIDGKFQISDKPMTIRVDQRYGKMTVRLVDPATETIILDNKDNLITLSKNKDIELMGSFHIRTADQDDTSVDNPLRYYLYCNESCDCGS